MLNADKLKNMRLKSKAGQALYDYILKRKRGIRNGIPMDTGRLAGELHSLGYTVSSDDIKDVTKEFPEVWEVIETPNRRPKIRWKLNPVHVARVISTGEVNLASRAPKKHIVSVEKGRLRFKINGVEIEAEVNEVGHIFKALGVK